MAGAVVVTGVTFASDATAELNLDLENKAIVDTSILEFHGVDLENKIRDDFKKEFIKYLSETYDIPEHVLAKHSKESRTIWEF